MLNTKLKKTIALVVTLIVITNMYSWHILSSGSWYDDPDAHQAEGRLVIKTNQKACLQFKPAGFLKLKADTPFLPNSLSSGIVVLNSVKLKLKNHRTEGYIRFFVNPFNSTLSATFVVDPESMESKSIKFKRQKTKCQ